METTRTYSPKESTEIKNLVSRFVALTEKPHENPKEKDRIEARLKELDIITPKGDFNLLINAPELDEWVNQLLFGDE